MLEEKLPPSRQELVSTSSISVEPFFVIRMEKEDKEQFQELVESIREIGIIEPIVVRPTTVSGFYELIAGSRRLKAAKAAGLSNVPCIIREDLNDEAALDLTLIENVNRRDLSHFETAHALAERYRRAGFTNIKEVKSMLQRLLDNSKRRDKRTSSPTVGELERRLHSLAQSLTKAFSIRKQHDLLHLYENMHPSTFEFIEKHKQHFTWKKKMALTSPKIRDDPDKQLTAAIRIMYDNDPKADRFIHNVANGNREFVKYSEPREIEEENNVGEELEKEYGHINTGGVTYTIPGTFVNKDAMSEYEMEFIPANELNEEEEVKEKNPEKQAQDRAVALFGRSGTLIHELLETLCGYPMPGTHEAAIENKKPWHKQKRFPSEYQEMQKAVKVTESDRLDSLKKIPNGEGSMKVLDGFLDYAEVLQNEVFPTLLRQIREEIETRERKEKEGLDKP